MAEQLISTAERDTLPDSYVRPETQRARLREVVPDAVIPVADLADPDRAALVARVAEACRTHGFFCSAAPPESTIISVSEIPLGDTGSFPPPPPSLSSPSSLPSLDTATTPAPDATASGREPVGIRRSGSPSPPPEPPAPPASATSVAKTAVHEDAMKVLLVIIGANITILMNIRDINSSWKTEWKVLYGSFMTLSLVSTVISLFTAMSPSDSWGTFSAFCARLGLLIGTPLFVIYLACQLGHFGCAAGVPTAALIVLVLGVVWWNSARRPATNIGTAPDSEPRRSTRVGGEEWIRS